MATPQRHLLLIDPQNDFCDLPAAACPADPCQVGAQRAPALPVPGAHADMQRVAALIGRLGGRLDAIHATLDSHQPLDIAHPAWWCDAQGASPTPFTVISAEQVQQGVWRARQPGMQARSLAYVQTLEQRGRYQLIIWPEHCLIGHWGHNVHAEVAHALDDWSRQQMRGVNYVIKGTNPWTEHYSAVQAEVPDPQDPATEVNRAWLDSLTQADELLIAGEALSHCVASTVRDLAALWPDATLERLVLLTDAVSPVAGFEALGTQFIEEMVARGMRRATTWDYLAA